MMLAEIAKVISHMVGFDPFYGYFTSSLDIQLSTKIPTACVCLENNKFFMLVNEEFFLGLTKEERAAVIKHEMLHLVFFHLTLWDEFQDKQLANIALDLEVNQHIPTSSIYRLPKNCILYEDFVKKYPTLAWIPKAGGFYYYNLLSKLSDEQKQELCGGYGKWSIDVHDWPSDMSSLEKAMAEQQLSDFLTKVGSNYRGTLPGEFETALKGFKDRTAVFNWKSHLRNFINYSQEYRVGKTRLRPNPLFEDRPKSKLKFKPKLLCAIDTSGSVSDQCLLEFMTEIHQIWKNGFTIDILCVDTDIHKPYPYVGQNDVKMLGRGGTYFTPTIEYFNKSEYGQMVYFTDGYAELPPDSKKPMLWVITPGGSIEYIKAHKSKKLLMKP